MRPIVDGLEAEYEGRVEVERLDIDQANTAEAKVTYKYRAQPFFVLVDGGGTVVATWQGAQEGAVFEEAFASLLGE